MKVGNASSLSWPLIVIAGLSVSIGWGVRGQFGHEYGAALAGALGGMAIALLGGRPDWLARVHYFAVLGAVGFAFGGQMSYMKTLAYIHSSDSATVLYGFVCLAVLGGIWAAPAGAGIALAAYLDREELTKLFAPLCAVFLAWHFDDSLRGWYRSLSLTRLLGPDGLNALVAVLVVLAMVLVRRRYWGSGSLLIILGGGLLGRSHAPDRLASSRNESPTRRYVGRQRRAGGRHSFLLLAEAAGRRGVCNVGRVAFGAARDLPSAALSNCW